MLSPPISRQAPRRAVAASAGGIVFTAGITPHDLATGKVVSRLDQVPATGTLVSGMPFIDMAFELIWAQTAQAVENLRRALSTAGADLNSMLHLRVLIADPLEEAAIADTLAKLLGPDRPAVSVQIVAFPDAVLRLQMDAVAVDAANAHRIGRGPVKASRPPFPAYTRFGSLLFTSLLTAPPLPSGGMPAARSDLSADAADYFDAAMLPRTAVLDPFAAEQASAYVGLQGVLAAEGMCLPDIVYLNEYYAGISMPNLVAGATPAISARIGRYCLSTFIMEELSTPARSYAGRAIAVSGFGSADASSADAPGNTVAPLYADACSAAGLIFTSGEIPIDGLNGVPITGYGNIPADLAGDVLGLSAEAATAQAQAEWVFAALAKTLCTQGANPENVVHQTVFLKHPADAAVIELVSARYFPEVRPPVTWVPVKACTPVSGSRFEIEWIAAETASRKVFFHAV